MASLSGEIMSLLLDSGVPERAAFQSYREGCQRLGARGGNTAVEQRAFRR